MAQAAGIGYQNFKQLSMFIKNDGTIKLEWHREHCAGQERMMIRMSKKKLPVGIDDFAKLRREAFYYVDKTGLVWCWDC